MREELSQFGIEYWKQFSDFGTWQFWVVLLMLIIPLIIVYFTIDREKIFKIGFYGFAVHVLFSYVDSYGIQVGLWGYPFQIVPFLPSLSLDAALVPVTIMLVYQWTLNYDKNFYLYALITSLILGFILKPLLVAFDLFEKYQWVNYFYLFLFYFIIFTLPYWLTRLFERMHRNAGKV